jgi:DNA-binding beta-propeller fold protein YncE
MRVVTRRELLKAAALAAPLLIGRAPSGRQPLALATGDTEGYVAVVGLASGRRLARVRTLDGPRSIEARGHGPVVVAHTAAGAVTLLERSGDRLAVRRVLRGFDEPRYTAISPDGRHAYVTDSATGEVAVVDLIRARVLRRVAVGALARHVTLDPAGGTLWIALGSSAERIVVVDVARDPARPRVTRHLAPPFLAHDVAFAPGGRRVWVTAGRRRRVAVYAARGEQPIRTLAADAAPQHVTFGAGRAFVASGEEPSVTVHGLSDGARRRRTATPLGSYNVQQAAGRVLTPSLNHGTLTVLDPAGRVLRQVRVAPAAHDACVVR